MGSNDHTTGPEPEPTGYVYTDPVLDEAYPRIVEPTGLDEFPPGWGDTPTERDLAAIQAGGA